MIKIQDILFQKLFESSIAEIKRFPIETITFDNALDTFNLWYELEYKYSQLKNKSFKGLPQRKENILNIIKDTALNINDVLADSFIEVFGNWLEFHAILNPKLWAEKRYEEVEDEGFDFESIIKSLFSEYRSYQGGESFQDTFEDIIYDINNFPVFKKLLTVGTIDFYQSDLDNMDEEEFQEQYGYLLKDLSIETKDEFEELLNSGELPENLILNYVELLTTNDIEYFVESLKNLMNYVYNVTEEDIGIEFYEKLVFPVWYGKWKAEGIDETRQNVEDVYNDLQNINSFPLKKQFALINIATNTAHQSGSIMDYYEERFNVGKSDLDVLTNKDVSEWDKELREIGVIFEEIVKFTVDNKGRNYYRMTSKDLRNLNVNDFKSGDTIVVNEKYIIHLKKEKYKFFSLETSVENYNTYKFIDPVFWPVFINNFIYSDYDIS